MGEPFTPPADYRVIWDSAEVCSGVPGDFNRVTWYVTPGNSFDGPDGYVIGRWTAPHSITIAHDWLTTDWVVKHEMIHDLLQEGHTEAQRIQIWGKQCHATWGYQPQDTLYIP